MSDVQRKFFAREMEIELYLEFLGSVQDLISNGTKNSVGHRLLLTPKHQQVLHASVFLHLYNLVESTVTWCIEHIESAVASHSSKTVSDLTLQLRKEWVKSVARTSEELVPEKRLEAALSLCGQVLNLIPPQLKFMRNGGGNWDDEKIFSLAGRIGFNLNISPTVHKRVRRPIRDDMGAMKMIKKMRNELAHGSISFSECGADHTVSDLRELSTVCLDYLKEFINCVDGYVTRFEYLDVASRPHKGVEL